MSVWAVALPAFLIAARGVPVHAAPIATRLELVENTAEGPAFDRCQIEGTLEKGQMARWRVFYGEARPDSDSGWSAIRSSSGCSQVGSGQATALTLRGSPYFLVDVALGQASVSGREVLIEAAFSIQRLIAFAQAGAPAYESRIEKRTLRVPEGSSVAVPILIASPREREEFRVRELFLKFRASAPGSGPPVAYGEISLGADVPRAEIFLDGGFVGRTSSDGPVLLRTVRTGQREVIVRDASRREARAVAQVGKGRRTNVSVTLMKGSAPADGPFSLGRNPQGSEEFWREKDGAIVVRIPGGEFPMGSPKGEGDPSDIPRHVVHVNGFLMDKTEVTWGQYSRFLAASTRPAPKPPPLWGMPEALPASSISWDDARAFCSWAGGRLPTEAEWERAARGDDARQYPWGDTWDPWRCNTRDGGPHAPTAAGAYPDCVNPYGVLDLAGSVSEWCSDRYSETDAKTPAENRTGPEAAARRVSHGGDWMSASSWVRVSSRQEIDPTEPGPRQGFRCVQDDRKPELW